MGVPNVHVEQGLNDNIYQKTSTNFHCGRLESEAEINRDLMQDVFDEHLEYMVEEFDIDTHTQRTDTTFSDVNIQQLCRIYLVAKSVPIF